MALFAVLLTAVYLVLGLLVIVTMRASEAVFKRVPTWVLLSVYLGAAALLCFTLWIGNPLAYTATAVIAMGIVVYLIVRVLPGAVPLVLDGMLRPFRRETTGRRGRPS